MLTAAPYLPLTWLLFGGLLAVLAWAVSVVLMQEGMIFGPLAMILERLPRWVGKPLGLCEVCFAGQLAFWSFLYWNYGRIGNVLTEWALFVAWVIFLTVQLKRFDT